MVQCSASRKTNDLRDLNIANYYGRCRCSKARWTLVCLVVVASIVFGVMMGVVFLEPTNHLVCLMIQEEERNEHEENRTSSTKFVEWLREDMTHNDRSCESYSVQRYVMAMLYFAMGVDVVLGESAMDLASNECDWKPLVKCDHTDCVTKISIHRQNLHGFIPSEIGLLSCLGFLRLFDNVLTGTIPTEIGKLSLLHYFDLSKNQLLGTIPKQIADLTKLEDMFLSQNRLTGTIPTQIGNFPQLVHLRLGYNQLIGTIPTQMNYLTRLEFLELQDNSLTGTISVDGRKLIFLCYLDLRNNLLTGPVPYVPGCLSSWGELRLEGNHLDEL